MPRGHARLTLAAALIAAASLGLAARAEAADPLRLGLTDSVYQDADPATRATWLQRTVSSRADLVLLVADWASIAPSNRPPGFEPSDPGDPAYSWDSVDAAVREANALGLDVVVLVNQAPAWAEGPNRPGFAEAPPGTWLPSPKKLKQFAKAIATRFSGSYVDPDDAVAGPLPRVRRFQLWAEPNLATYLTPQWRSGRPRAANHYREMLNAFYRGINEAEPGDVVMTGGTAPYGDPGHGRRLRPARFWREVLCLRHDLSPAPCDEPAHFDVAAHNPINVGAPARHALHRDDISTPDLGTLRRLLSAANASGRARPRGPKPIWATELWWESKPPDPDGVPKRRHARWLSQALYLLWRQEVRAAVWFQIRDAAPQPSFASTFQTGLYFRDGDAKLAQRAFRFPFAADELRGRAVRVWGEAPGAGEVTVEAKRRDGWHPVERLRAGANRVFAGKVRTQGTPHLRARAGTETSLAWRR